MPVKKCFLNFIACLLMGFSICNTNPVTAESPKATNRPILVVKDQNNATNPFGKYLCEILRSEGLVQFDKIDRTDAKSIPDAAKLLANYQVVILAEMELDAGEEELLRKYVDGGGLLIAMRPDADLSDLFGIQIEDKRSEKLLQYFTVATDLPQNPKLPVGMGIVSDSLQYHGEATNYKLDGAKPLAFLYDAADTPSHNPAVTLNRYGKGFAVAYAFDLAKSIVLMRQGNPEWKDVEGDGVPLYRPADMFFRLDGRTYTDLNRFKIPQADESQRLLANILMSLSAKPLVRMWYLPGMHKTLMVNTGDAEDYYGELLDKAFDDCAKYDGHFTAFLRNGAPGRGIEKTSVEKEAAWRKAGHEAAAHMYGNRNYEELDAAYGKIVNDMKTKFGHGAHTARNHTICWTGWIDMAAIEAKHGTGMDMNYYHYLGIDNTIDTNGYFNGTGLPQRFMDADGKLLPIYQATTQWSDEWFADKGLTLEQTTDIIKKMFEAAENGYYSAFINNIHQVRYDGSCGEKLTGQWPIVIWKYCQEKGIPSWSGEMLLDFVQARNAARFENTTWNVDASSKKSQLSFDFLTPTPGQDLTVMIPVKWSNQKLWSISVDGKPIDWTFQHIKGFGYAMFTTNRSHAKFVATYTMP